MPSSGFLSQPAGKKRKAESTSAPVLASATHLCDLGHVKQPLAYKLGVIRTRTSRSHTHTWRMPFIFSERLKKAWVQIPACCRAAWPPRPVRSSPWAPVCISGSQCGGEKISAQGLAGRRQQEWAMVVVFFCRKRHLLYQLPSSFHRMGLL